MPEPLRSQINLAAMVAVAAVPLLLLAVLLPRGLVLPTLCLVTIASASVVSFSAWTRGVNIDAPSVTAWDVAGALTFIACASAILSDPRYMIALTM
jgi:hypothetical protein